MTEKALPTAYSNSRSRWLSGRQFAANNSTLLVTLALLIVFGLTANVFLTGQNIFNILRQMSVVATVGIGMTLVILIGGIDLSVGSTLFMSAGLSALLLAQEQPVATAILVGIAASTCV